MMQLLPKAGQRCRLPIGAGTIGWRRDLLPVCGAIMVGAVSCKPVIRKRSINAVSDISMSPQMQICMFGRFRISF